MLLMDTKKQNIGSGRRHRSASERRKLLEAFYASGLSQSEFSRQMGLHPGTLSKWVIKDRTQSHAEPSFREVLVIADAPEEVALHLAGGIKLTTTAAVAAKLIRELSSC